MFLGAGPMVEMGGMAATWCLSATRRVGTWGRCGGASTFGLGGVGVAKGRTGMGLGGMSW
jgi:hypothetical protein